MKFVKLLTHLFIPHESNNQKAKILHSGSLALIAVFLIVFQLVLSYAHTAFPSVLGYAANISPGEVVRLTNAQRAASGLAPLTENSKLDSAALAKGNDMLAKGYWAHFAPDGTSPWSFFLTFGYRYRYAGENLARDFSDPSSAVNAWMNSPTHKDNILNPKYKEIGIGVVEGSLSGVDTTIIVQFFGAPAGGEPAISEVKAKDVSAVASSSKPVIKKATPAPTTVVVATFSPTPTASPSPSPTSANAATSFISPFQTTKGISLGVTGLLLLVLSIDLIVVRRKRIARIGGRTLAHLAFLGMILAVILILKAGQII
jgi:uncharacterized protein YkwD